MSVNNNRYSIIKNLKMFTEVKEKNTFLADLCQKKFGRSRRAHYFLLAKSLTDRYSVLRPHVFHPPFLRHRHRELAPAIPFWNDRTYKSGLHKTKRKQPNNNRKLFTNNAWEGGGEETDLYNDGRVNWSTMRYNYRRRFLGTPRSIHT